MTTRRVGRIRPSALPDEGPTPLFSADELIAAIESVRAEQPASQGLSTTDLMAKLNWPHSRVLKHLKALYRAGRLVVNREMRTAFDGIPRPVAVYRVKP